MKQPKNRKSLIAGVVTVAVVAYGIVGSQFGLPAMPEWAYAVLAGLGITVAAADIEKLKPQEETKQE